MASTTSDSLHSSPDVAVAPAALLDDQEFSSFLDPITPFFPFASAEDPAAAPPVSLPSRPPTRGPKPPRKRPRASRRPPTTVLTTDTSNFRAMVQEFTGFPVAPFAGPPPPLRPRLLAGPTSSMSPQFLLRPSPLKFPHSTPPPATCTTRTTTSNNTTSSTATSTSSLVDALALLAKSTMIPAATTTAPSFGPMLAVAGAMPFDGFETAAAGEGERVSPSHGLFSSLGAGEKYERS